MNNNLKSTLIELIEQLEDETFLRQLIVIVRKHIHKRGRR